MIAPDAALELVRNELRNEVLTRLHEDDDYVRSIVVAAIGVLGEVAPRVVLADAWCEPSVRELRESARSWAGRLSDDRDAARRVGDLVERARSAETLSAERGLLLEAAQEVVTTLWAGAPTAEGEALRREVRTLLAADAELEVERSGRSG